MELSTMGSAKAESSDVHTTTLDAINEPTSTTETCEKPAGEPTEVTTTHVEPINKPTPTSETNDKHVDEPAKVPNKTLEPLNGPIPEAATYKKPKALGPINTKQKVEGQEKTTTRPIIGTKARADNSCLTFTANIGVVILTVLNILALVSI